MARNIKGITIEFRGDTTKLHKAIRQVQSDAHKTDNELKQINRSLKLNPKNIDLLRQKQSLLNTRIKETRENLSQLKSAQKQLDTSGVDKNSAEYRRLQREIINTENQLKTAEAELKRFGSVGKQQAIAVGKQFKAMGDKLSSAGKTMTTYVTPALSAGFGFAIKEASDYTENLNKVDVAFGSSSKAVKQWANAATESFGLSKNAALEMTAQFGDMGTSMGLSKKDAAEMSTSLAGLAGDLASFKNIGVDEAMTALNGVFTGETESLKTLGIVMTETNLKQFADDCGLVYDAMTQAEKVQLRYNYVMAQTTNAQGDYDRTSDGTANSIRTLTQELSNLAISFGELVLPIVTPIIQAFTKLIGKITELPTPIKSAIAILGGLLLAAGPLLIFVGSMVSAIGTLIATVGALNIAMGPITLIVLGIAAAIAAAIAIGVLLYKNWDAIKTKATEIKDSISETWNGIKQSVSDSVKALKITIANVFGGIKSITTRLWKGIKNAITHPIKTAVNLVRSAINKIKSIINMAKLKLPKIKLPHFSLKGKLSLMPPSVPSISVDWYKTGGIFNRPTIAGIGEAGPEAVIPIDKLKEYISEAMRDASDDMANAVSTGLALSTTAPMQQPIQITINLGGAKVAEQIVRLYDKGKRQVG